MLNIDDDGRRGGADLTLSFTGDQADALGQDGAELAEWLDTVLVGIAALRTGQVPAVPEGGRASGKDRPIGRYWADRLLRESSALLARIEGVRDAALREHVAADFFFSDSAQAMGSSKGTAQHRRTRVRTGLSAAELWARGQRGPVDHPGTAVPDELRDWSQPWEGYCPVDITPDELLPDAIGGTGWAEPYPTPHEVPDLRARAREALIPYRLDERGWPLNPAGRTGRSGRNLGRWGETAAGDLVALTHDEQILLVKRADNGLWATPGGGVEPGESALAAIVREAAEETGVHVDPAEVQVFDPVYVHDWRATDHAWIVTTPGYILLPEPIETHPGDDAADARWWPCTEVDALEAALAEAGQSLSPAHRPLIAATLVRASRALDDDGTEG